MNETDLNPNHLFTLTQEHLDLLKHVKWSWNRPTTWPDKIGAPAINSSMPFGHQTVDADQICRALQWTTASGTFGNYSESQRREALQLWRGTLQALQIICSTQSVEKGNYRFDVKSNRWFKIKQEFA